MARVIVITYIVLLLRWNPNWQCGARFPWFKQAVQNQLLASGSNYLQRDHASYALVEVNSGKSVGLKELLQFHHAENSPTAIQPQYSP